MCWRYARHGGEQSCGAQVLGDTEAAASTTQEESTLCQEDDRANSQDEGQGARDSLFLSEVSSRAEHQVH